MLEDAPNATDKIDESKARCSQGERLTNERAEQIAQQTLAEARRRNLIPGGKSLSDGGVHSPRVQFRVPEELRTQAQQIAEGEGISLSALARHALEDYVRSHASRASPRPNSDT